MINIHGTLISVDGKGVLLKGESGSGKSDLALRFIKNEKAKLVADDRVDIDISDNRVIGKAPLILKGKLEVRNIGIIEDVETTSQVDVFLCVELVKNRERVLNSLDYIISTIQKVKVNKSEVVFFKTVKFTL